MQDGKNHASKERLTDAASSTQQSKLVFHYSEPAEEEWKPAVPDWDLVPATYLPTYLPKFTLSAFHKNELSFVSR